jgi:hypothetical protein
VCGALGLFRFKLGVFFLQAQFGKNQGMKQWNETKTAILSQ